MGDEDRRERRISQLRTILGSLLIGLVLIAFVLEYQQSGATLDLITNTLEGLLDGLKAIEEGQRN